MRLEGEARVLVLPTLTNPVALGPESARGKLVGFCTPKRLASLSTPDGQLRRSRQEVERETCVRHIFDAGETGHRVWCRRAPEVVSSPDTARNDEERDGEHRVVHPEDNAGAVTVEAVIDLSNEAEEKRDQQKRKAMNISARRERMATP